MKKLQYYHQGKPSQLPLPEQMREAPLDLYKEEDLKQLIQNEKQRRVRGEEYDLQENR